MVQSKIGWSQFRVKGYFCFDQGMQYTLKRKRKLNERE